MFSLGIVLFEMASGKQLFPRAHQSTLAHLDSVSAFDAPVPAKFLPGVPARLAALIAGLLRNDPARRVPGTAHKLAAKLAALAIELAPGYTRQRWVRTARTTALVVAGGLVVAGLFQLKRTHLAPVNLARTPPPKVVEPEPESVVRPNGLPVAVTPPDTTIPPALVAGKSAKNLDQLDRDEITREAAIGAGDGDAKRVAPEVVAVIDVARKPGDPGHTGFVEAVALHPDGALLATGGADNTVRLWDLSGAAPKHLATLKNHKTGVTALAFTSDGKWLVSGSAGGTVIAWKVGSDEEAAPYELRDGVVALAVSRTENRVAVGNSSENARVLELDTGKERPVIRGNRHGTGGLVFAPDNSRLFLGSIGALRVLSNGVGRVIGSRVGWGRLLPGFGNNHDTEMHYALSVRDLKTAWVTHTVMKHDGRVCRAEFVSEDKYVISLTDDCRVHLWAWGAEARLATVVLGHNDVAHKRECRSMAVHPDGRHAIVCRTNGQVYVVRFNLKP